VRLFYQEQIDPSADSEIDMQEQVVQSGPETSNAETLERASRISAIAGIIVIIASYVIPLILIAFSVLNLISGGGWLLELLSPGVFSRMVLATTIALGVMALVTLTGLALGIMLYRQGTPRKQQAVLLIAANGGLCLYFAFFTVIELFVYLMSQYMFRRF